jgi:hypothetical protein
MARAGARLGPAVMAALRLELLSFAIVMYQGYQALRLLSGSLTTPCLPKDAMSMMQELHTYF